MNQNNFTYWKEMVGLDEGDFPRFLEPTEDNVSKAKIAPRRVDAIRRAITQNSIVDVQVQPGWGATTLFYYMAHDLRDKDLKLLVKFDLEKDGFSEEILDEDLFVFRAKWKMAKALSEILREKSFQEWYMYEVFGFEDTGKKNWRAHLREKSLRLNNCEQKKDVFYREYPFFERMELPDLMNYFLSNFQLQTVFMYLFPRKAAEDEVLDFVGNIKNLFDGKDIQAAAFREVYFITPKLFKLFKQAYVRPYRDILYERYSTGEIFSMLVNVYSKTDGYLSVTDVFEEEFIKRVYNEKSTLNQIMDKVAEEIVSFLDGDVSEIPYKLSFRPEKEEEEM